MFKIKHIPSGTILENGLDPTIEGVDGETLMLGFDGDIYELQCMNYNGDATLETVYTSNYELIKEEEER